jgi:hypothetical protein
MRDGGMCVDRRVFLGLMAVGAASGSWVFSPAIAQDTAPSPQTAPFSFDWLVEEAGGVAASDL